MKWQKNSCIYLTFSWFGWRFCLFLGVKAEIRGFYIVGLKPLPCFGVLVCCSCCFHWRGCWGGVTKRYPLMYDGSILFPMLYGYYRRVSRRWLVYECFLPFERRIRCFRIILHHRFTRMLLFEHELPSIAINLWLLHDNSCYDLNTNCH